MLFAGYLHPHPLDHDILVKVQTNGAAAPVQALQDAATALVTAVSGLDNDLAAQRPAPAAAAEGGLYAEG